MTCLHHEATKARNHEDTKVFDATPQGGASDTQTVGTNDGLIGVESFVRRFVHLMDGRQSRPIASNTLYSANSVTSFSCLRGQGFQSLRVFVMKGTACRH